MRPTLTALRVARAAALVVLVLVVFGNAYGHFHTDIKPEVYVAPGRMLLQYFSSWSTTPYLGAANFNVGLVPVLVVTAALRAIGLSPELTFKTFHLVLWVLGAWGAGRLLREIVPKVSPWAVFATGVVFLANPYTITGGNTLAIALPMCLLPWLLVCLTRGLRSPRSWAWPALGALVLFGMSGMNVAVVPIYQLLMAIPLVILLRQAWSLTWGTVARVVARFAVLCIGASLYWFVPSVAAQATGSQVVKGSETLDGIAKVSSYVEVLRGLGMWTLYGRSDTGAWMPQYAIYITVTMVVLITMLWPALALLSMRWTPPTLTKFAAVSAAGAAVVMVGLFPGDPASPAGWLMGWAFENVPGTVAFRTTNKIGSVLALSFALLLGYAVHRAAGRIRSIPGAAPAAAGVAFLLVVNWAAPAFNGNLYTSEFDVPDYWHDAAEAVDAESGNGRVMLLPGQVRAFYRWSQERPDDVTNSLMARDAVIPETTSSTSAGGANLLNALDDTLQSQAPYDNATSTFARYLGVDQILLRHDTVWEDAGGARPGVTSRALADDPGLFGQANFGEPGENILPPTIPPESLEESVLSPVQQYLVENPVPTIRVRPMHGSLIVNGDAFAIPPMARDGLLERTPVIRYVSDLQEGDLASSFGQGSRIVVTDTNRRREAVTNRLTAGNGPLLAADEEVELGRALGDTEDQTVLVRSGVRAVGTEEGAAFFKMPNAVAENAVDGDPRTSWIFGDFNRAPGMALDITLPQARTLDEVTIEQSLLGPVRIDDVELSAGGRTVTGSFDGEESLRLDLGGVRTDTVRLEVGSVSGEGFNLVAISEVDLGVPDRAERTARLPTSLDERYGSLTPAERRDFSEVPLDVFFNRVLNTPSTVDDEETGLRRDFTLPDDRTFRATARLRMLGDWERQYDTMDGHEGASFRSSGVFFNNPEVRASRAADGDGQTAWVPDSDLQGAWWEVRAPEERVYDEVEVVQGDAFGTDADGTRFAEEVRVLVDGEEAGRGRVGRGRSVVTLDRPTRGRTLRVEVSRASLKEGETGVARFLTIDTGVSLEGKPSRSRSCLPVATIDDNPVLMRPASDGGVALADSQGAVWEACEDLELTWGEHTLRPLPTMQLDALALRDRQGLEPSRPAAAPTSQVDPQFGGGATIRTGAARSPYAIVVGQGFDPRWQATMDGESLGPPRQLDGYSVGWIIEDVGEPHEFVIGFGPQRSATIASLVSGTVLVICGYLIGAALLRRRQEAEAKGEGEGDSAEPDAPVVPGGAAAEDGAEAQAPAAAGPLDSDGPEVPAEAAPEVDRETGHDGLQGTAGPPARLGTRWGLLAVVLATLVVGIPGLVAAGAAVVLARLGRVGPRRLIDLGALLVMVSVVVYVLGPGGDLRTVDADAISASLWPHHLAGTGLVLAVLGGLWRAGTEDPSPEEIHESE